MPLEEVMPLVSNPHLQGMPFWAEEPPGSCTSRTWQPTAQCRLPKLPLLPLLLKTLKACGFTENQEALARRKLRNIYFGGCGC